jgi:AraC-like DNA-binding protein
MAASRQILVRARALVGFPDLVRAHGGDPAALLARARISPAALRNPDAPIALDRLARLLDAAATVLGVPDFGIQLAAQQGFTGLGAIALIAQNANTAGEALRGVGRNLRYHTAGARLELVDDPRAGCTEIRYDMNLGPGVPRRQALELSYAVALGFVRLVTGTDPAGWRIDFTHTEGMSAARYLEAYGCPVQLGQRVDRLVLPTQVLDAPIRPENAELRIAAERCVANVMRRYPLDVQQQVEALIERQLAGGRCGIDLVAGQMGLHTRTLQRRLDQQGSRFEEIIDRVRRERAAELLPHSVLPLSQVGQLLGYSEQSSFTRACHRWFGRTPEALRAAARPAQGPAGAAGRRRQ